VERQPLEAATAGRALRGKDSAPLDAFAAALRAKEIDRIPDPLPAPRTDDRRRHKTKNNNADDQEPKRLPSQLRIEKSRSRHADDNNANESGDHRSTMPAASRNQAVESLDDCRAGFLPLSAFHLNLSPVSCLLFPGPALIPES
jgi:hypothetical protein